MQVADLDPLINASKDRKIRVLIGPRLTNVLSKALTPLVQKGCTQRRFLLFIPTQHIHDNSHSSACKCYVFSHIHATGHHSSNSLCFPESVHPHGTREWAQGEMGAYWVRLCTCSCRGQRTVSSACQGFVADLPCDPGSRTGLFWECASRP